jgi:two-component system sensor histidine kinase ChiS
MDGTVISDAVNLASRIEGLTKFYGVQCLISENIYHSLSEPDRHSIRYVDKVKVKGKHVPVRIFEEFSADPLSIQDKKRLTLGTFEEATRLFAVKEFARAREMFEKVLEELPEDKASKSYIARCDRYASQELPDDWDGALDFDFK